MQKYIFSQNFWTKASYTLDILLFLQPALWAIKKTICLDAVLFVIKKTIISFSLQQYETFTREIIEV